MRLHVVSAECSSHSICHCFKPVFTHQCFVRLFIVFAEHSSHSICRSFKPVFIRQCFMRLSVFAEHSCHICHCFKSLLADVQEICLLFLRCAQQSKHLSFEISFLTPVLLEIVVSVEHSCHSICRCSKPVLLHQYFIIRSTPSLCQRGTKMKKHHGVLLIGRNKKNF